MQRLILIDGHAILHRAYHAIPPLTNSEGKLVNAVFGFTSMLLKVINDLQPKFIAVTFDRPKPTFRKKMYKHYQAKRPEMDKELSGQIEMVHEVVKKMGLAIYEMDGYEADDVIGTLVSKVKNLKSTTQNQISDEDIETVIVTGDRDILQLVEEKTKVYMPVKGLSESMLYGEEQVEKKFGVKASQIIDYKALVGDQSDNYPGVPGIGPKSASSLLCKFHTLENIYDHLYDIENMKLRNKLEQNKNLAILSKQLATIIHDVPIVVDFDKLKLGALLKPNIVSFLEKLGLRSLIPRLGGNNNKQIARDKEQKKDSIKQKTNKNEQISLL